MRNAIERSAKEKMKRRIEEDERDVFLERCVMSVAFVVCVRVSFGFCVLRVYARTREINEERCSKFLEKRRKVFARFLSFVCWRI